MSKYVLKSEVRRKAYVQFTDVKDTFGSTIFKWFIPVECDYNIKYKNDIRWVSQNTTQCCVLTHPPCIILIFDIVVRYSRKLVWFLCHYKQPQLRIHKCTKIGIRIAVNARIRDTCCRVLKDCVVLDHKEIYNFPFTFCN